MKKICAMCLSLVVLIGCFGITGFAAGTELVNETFDNLENLSGFNIATGSPAYKQAAATTVPNFVKLEDGGNVGKGVKISVNKDTYKGAAGIGGYNLAQYIGDVRFIQPVSALNREYSTGKQYVFEYQVMLTAKNVTNFQIQPFNDWSAIVNFGNDGKIYYSKEWNLSNNLGSWEPNRIYNVTFVYNNTYASTDNSKKNNCTIYIDGKQTISYKEKATMVTKSRLDADNDPATPAFYYYIRPNVKNYDSVGSCDIYLDNVRFSEYAATDTVDIKKPSFDADYASDGKVYFNGNKTVTVAEVKNTLNAASTSKVLMQKDGRILADTDAVTEGTKVYEITAGNVFEFDAIPVVNKMERTNSTVNTTLITHPNFGKMLTDSNVEKIEFPANKSNAGSVVVDKTVKELYANTDFEWMNDYVLSKDDGSTLTVEAIDAQKALKIHNKFREAYIQFNNNKQNVNSSKKLVIQGSYIYNALPYKKSGVEYNSNTLMSYNGEELVSVMPDKRIQISPWFAQIDTDVKVSDNQEFSVAAIVDMTNYTYDVYINGSLAAEDVAINGNNNKIAFKYSKIWQRGESAGENGQNETFKDLYVTDFSIYQPTGDALADISELTPGEAAEAPVKKLSVSLWKDTDLSNVRLIKSYGTENGLDYVTVEKLSSNGIYAGFITGNEPNGIYLWNMNSIRPLVESINK